MISDYYQTKFTIKRAVWKTDGDGNQYSEEQEIGTIDGHIQQANMELAQHLALSLTKTYSLFLPETSDIQEGDSLIDDDGNVYSVKAKQVNNLGDNSHLELLCELDKAVTPEN